MPIIIWFVVLLVIIFLLAERLKQQVPMEVLFFCSALLAALLCAIIYITALLFEPVANQITIMDSANNLVFLESGDSDISNDDVYVYKFMDADNRSKYVFREIVPNGLGSYTIETRVVDALESKFETPNGNETSSPCVYHTHTKEWRNGPVRIEEDKCYRTIFYVRGSMVKTIWVIDWNNVPILQEMIGAETTSS